MTWKIVSVFAYFAVLLGIGIAASRRMKDLRDYFAGGKQLGFLAVAFSARATGESGWLLLGLTGMGAMVGFHAMWIVLGEVIGVTLAWLWMSRRFKRLTDRYDSITIPDYLESRFRSGKALRMVAAFALCVFVTIYVAAQIHATGKAFATFLDWNYWIGAVVGFLIVLAYSTSGGFLAVAWSDIFQGVLMFVGLVGLPIVAFWVLGGWSETTERLTPEYAHLLTLSGGTWTAFNVLEAIGFVLIGVGFMGSPQIFVRFLALKSEDEINKGASVAIVWTVLADTGAVLVGVFGRALLGDTIGADKETVLPMLTEYLLHPALVGLMIAIVLSAVMSTIDSLLVLAASACVRDVYQKVLRPETPDNALIAMSRWATVVLAAIALGIVALVAGPDSSVFLFVIFGWSGIAATFCPTIILSLFWPRFTERGALAAMVAGFLAVPFFAFAAPELPTVGPYLAKLSELPPAIALSFLAGVVFTLTDPKGQKRLQSVAEELRDAGR